MQKHGLRYKDRSQSKSAHVHSGIVHQHYKIIKLLKIKKYSIYSSAKLKIIYEIIEDNRL